MKTDTPRTNALIADESRRMTPFALSAIYNLARQLERELAAAQERLHNVREIYTGMDGFIPETAPEGYQQRIMRQMYEAASKDS